MSLIHPTRRFPPTPHAPEHEYGGIDLVRDLDYLAIRGTTVLTGDRTLQYVAKIAQSLLPDADATRDLGTLIRRWRDGHLSGTLIAATDVKAAGVSILSHADRHAVGAADPLPSNAITTAMLNFGTWEKLAEVVPTTDITYIDFTGLDINSDISYLVLASLKNPTGSSCTYRLFVEADYTLTNYYSQWLYVSGSGVYAGRVNEPRSAWIGAGQRTAVTLRLFRNPDGHFHFVVYESAHVGSDVFIHLISGASVYTYANVTSLRIQAAVSGGIGAGSKILLCRPRTK